MSAMQSFGDPARFEIAARWSTDPEPRERLPAEGGWSTAELRIVVAGQVLTEHVATGARQTEISWYLAPLLDWLIANWTSMLHEERFAWRDHVGLPAAIATQTAIDRTLGASDADSRAHYERIHAWRSRHALRAADSSGLYPDLYVRRSVDDIELSWGARRPAHAPDGFSFALAPGYALLAVEEVATPLWQFMTWALDSAPVHHEVDNAHRSRLERRFETLSRTPLQAFEQVFIGQRLQRLVDDARTALATANDEVLLRDCPAVKSFDSAVLMFGGLDIDLGAPDVERLLRFLVSVEGGSEASSLARMVSQSEETHWLPPYEEGYRLAEQCRDDLAIPLDQLFVDVESILRDDLGVEVVDAPLETPAIRGFAVAGVTHSPAIFVNTSHPFNSRPEGRRFTLAHELCHLIRDRTRARKLSHLSGRWAPSRVEKRANAFAAMFLATTQAVRGRIDSLDPESIGALANQLGLSFRALVEHLYNVDLIDEVEREDLRSI